MNRRLVVLLAVAGVLVIGMLVLPRVRGGDAVDNTPVTLAPPAAAPAAVPTTTSTTMIAGPPRDPFAPLVSETPPTTVAPPPPTTVAPPPPVLPPAETPAP